LGTRELSPLLAIRSNGLVPRPAAVSMAMA
jgi:hypothetical protein